ncbi:MAG: ribonuclease E/G [Alphaproteobacteria bacterium]
MAADPVRAEALLIERVDGVLAAALIRGGALDDLLVQPEDAAGPGSVLVGRVSRIETGMAAAFVDVGMARHALLRARDLDRALRDRPIDRALHEGQMLAVQLVHPGYDDKGPRVIARLDPALAGEAAGKAAGTPLRRPDNLAAALAAFGPAAPAAIVVADPVMRLQAERAAAATGLDAAVEVDRDGRPLERCDARGAIAGALDREVPLAGGGRLTFDPTRALMAVDVDAGAGARDLAACNRAAAGAIARQLRIRNSAGVIVIDFIDVADPGQRQAVETALRAAVAPDRAGCSLAGFGPLGLYEMTRRRRGAALADCWPGAHA